MRKLKIQPNQAGYSIERGNTVLFQELEGGAGRYDRDIQRKSHTVNVSWTVNSAKYEYLQAFYMVWVQNPSEAFLADLIIDSSELAEYQCYFRSPINLNNKVGGTYTVGAVLEVLAIAPDVAEAIALIDGWEA